MKLRWPFEWTVFRIADVSVLCIAVILVGVAIYFCIPPLFTNALTFLMAYGSGRVVYTMLYRDYQRKVARLEAEREAVRAYHSHFMEAMRRKYSPELHVWFGMDQVPAIDLMLKEMQTEVKVMLFIHGERRTNDDGEYQEYIIVFSNTYHIYEFGHRSKDLIKYLLKGLSN